MEAKTVMMNSCFSAASLSASLSASGDPFSLYKLQHFSINSCRLLDSLCLFFFNCFLMILSVFFVFGFVAVIAVDAVDAVVVAVVADLVDSVDLADLVDVDAVVTVAVDADDDLI